MLLFAREETMRKNIFKITAILLILVLALPFGGCGKPKEFEISVLSQNLRVDSSSDGEENSVMLRSDRFLWLLDQYQPDLIGMQEFTPSWDFFIFSELEERGYGIVFKYRATNSHEATPIAYKKDKMELLEENYFWLSDTPEEESPSWDDGKGKRCRIVTECVFKEKKTGIQFAHLNTHYGLTDTSEVNSSNLLHTWIEEKYADMPLILTGDFNMREEGLGYNPLIYGGPTAEGEPLLINSRHAAEEKGADGGTSNGFKVMDNYTSIIDFVFVTKQIKPTYYTVLYDKPEGKFVSDHFGVLTRQIVGK